MVVRNLRAEDGGWGLATEPAENRLFVTGMLTGLLGRTRVVRPHVLTKASAFMERLWSRDRIEGRAWPAITAFAVFFSTVDHDHSRRVSAFIAKSRHPTSRGRQSDFSFVQRIILLRLQQQTGLDSPFYQSPRHFHHQHLTI